MEAAGLAGGDHIHAWASTKYLRILISGSPASTLWLSFSQQVEEMVQHDDMSAVTKMHYAEGDIGGSIKKRLHWY